MPGLSATEIPRPWYHFFVADAGVVKCEDSVCTGATWGGGKKCNLVRRAIANVDLSKKMKRRGQFDVRARLVTVYYLAVAHVVDAVSGGSRHILLGAGLGHVHLGKLHDGKLHGGKLERAKHVLELPKKHGSSAICSKRRRRLTTIPKMQGGKGLLRRESKFRFWAICILPAGTVLSIQSPADAPWASNHAHRRDSTSPLSLPWPVSQRLIFHPQGINRPAQDTHSCFEGSGAHLWSPSTAQGRVLDPAQHGRCTSSPPTRNPV